MNKLNIDIDKMIRRVENITTSSSVVLTILGFAGLAGSVETGNGFLFSIIVLAIGLYLTACSYFFGNIRRRNDNKRIYRKTYR